MTVKEFTVQGKQLITDFKEYSIDDVSTKNKLSEILSDYISKWSSGDRESGLLLPPENVIDNAGKSVELLIEKSGDLISRPAEGKILFLSYYFYEGEVYTVPLRNDKAVTAISKRFYGEYYITKFAQGDQELFSEPKDIGKHNGDVSWKLLLHNKTKFMDDFPKVVPDSVDMNKLVEDIFPFFEKYLPLKKINTSNKKIKDATQNSNFVLCIDMEFVERKFEDEEWPDEEYYKTSLKTIEDFVNDIKDKIKGNIADRILICNPEEYFIDDLKQGIKKIKCFDGIKVYVLITKEISALDLDSILLDIDTYGFYASYPNNEGEIITQGYDEGEYDTGYFAATIGNWDLDAKQYINIESLEAKYNQWRQYKNYDAYYKAKDILINGVTVNDQEWAINLCKKAERIAKSFNHLISIADEIYKKLGDKKWARKVYEKAEDKAVSSHEFLNLAESISNNLLDKKWAKLIKQRASD